MPFGADKGKAVMWQFAISSGLPYFCGKMGGYVVIYAYWITNV